MTEVALEANGLSRRYRSTWALRDCSLRITRTRVVALVGPNGAGKTTFLQLAMGLDQPDAGQIRLFRLSPTAQATTLLPLVGFLAQDRPLYRRFSVEDLFTFGRRLNPRWDQPLAVNWVKRLGISLDRSLGHLSGGEQAQVALAMVLAKRPELLLLDEPVAGLDPLARRQFLETLMEFVAAEKLTVVLSSHIISELERTCDYLVILSHGRIQLDGEIAHLLRTHGEVGLEELVLTYLRRPETAGSQSSA